MGMDNLAARAAEDVDAARGPLRPRRAHGAAQADPGRAPGSAAARPTPLPPSSRSASCSSSSSPTTTSSRSRPSSAPTCRSASRAAPRGCGAGARSSSRWSLRPGSASSSRSRRSASPPRLVYKAWDELGGPEAARRVEPQGPVARLIGELANDLEPAAEAVEPGLGGLPAGPGAGRGPPGDPGRQRLGLRGAARAGCRPRRCSPRASAARCGCRSPGARSTAVGVRIGS